ncbi:uncharacterized protein [Amphiura filiformis]|uniref:uncharacterized protein n=1 Tax=Amphiura filiformis TaxID=82378 RepID=UPI003B217851
MAEIDVLNIDELLIIFNFLSLYDRLMAMRVCRKWYYIIRDTHAWTVIDFQDKGPVKANSERRHLRRFVAKHGQDLFTFRECDDHNRWQFPNKTSDVLTFICQFARMALQEIYLNVINDEIMECLRRYFPKICPNVVTFDFSNSKVEWFNTTLDDDIGRKIYLPPKLKRLGLVSPGMMGVSMTLKKAHQGFKRAEIVGQRNERIFSYIADKCSNLQKICLCRFQLTSSCMQQLIKMTKLKEIELNSCFLPHFCAGDDILTESFEILANLTCLKIDRPFDEFGNRELTLSSSVAKWENLKILSLRLVDVEVAAFGEIIPRLVNVESLELHSPSVTSSVVTLIGKHVKKVTSLVLTGGSYSGESLKSLCHHQSLQTLVVGRCYADETSQQWLHAVYDVLITLPNIKRVKLLDRDVRVHEVYAHGKFPVIESAEIQLDNCIEY